MFKNDCETISKKDLNEFFQTWYFTNDYLEYQIEKVTTTSDNNQYENYVVINKIGKANISHVEIEIICENGEMLKQQFHGREQSKRLNFTTKAPIKSIILDPDFKLLLVNRIKKNQ